MLLLLLLEAVAAAAAAVAVATVVAGGAPGGDLNGSGWSTSSLLLEDWDAWVTNGILSWVHPGCG